MFRNVYTGEIFKVVAINKPVVKAGKTSRPWRLRAVEDGYEMYLSEDELRANFDEYYLKAPPDDEIADSIRQMSMWWGRWHPR